MRWDEVVNFTGFCSFLGSTLMGAFANASHDPVVSATTACAYGAATGAVLGVSNYADQLYEHFNLKNVDFKQIAVGAGIGAVFVPVALATEGYTANYIVISLIGATAGGGVGALIQSPSELTRHTFTHE